MDGQFLHFIEFRFIFKSCDQTRHPYLSSMLGLLPWMLKTAALSPSVLFHVNSVPSTNPMYQKALWTPLANLPVTKAQPTMAQATTKKA